MRNIISILATLALTVFAHAELTVISAEHRDTDSFKRVSEFLTGKHSDGRYTVFRSNDSSRDGFYVSLLAKDRSTISQAATLKVQFVRAGTQDIESFELPTGTLKKKRILVGFTGSEWQDSGNHPVAWKIDLLDSTGTSIDSAQSFLWAEPNP